MVQEVEIEFKNLLTADEFNRLASYLAFPDEAVKQTNYYFETADYLLKTYGSALRIREKNGTYTLTLKEPHPDGLLETHDPLTKQEKERWLSGQHSKAPNVTRQLQKKGIALSDLYYIGQLVTKRRQQTYKQTIVVLDESMYNGRKDYELEVEATDYKTGLTVFRNLLDTLAIPQRETPNKIKRFFTSRAGKNEQQPDQLPPS